MRRLRLLAIAALALSASGCSLLDVPPPTNSTSGIPIDPNKRMSASIDGIAWEARAVVVNTNSTSVRFTGVLNPGEISQRSITLQFNRDQGGTQTFGSDGSAVFAQVGVGNSELTVWSTKTGGPNGTVTVTVAAANHFIGNFSFDAQGLFADSNPLIRHVVNGTFDITF